MEACNTSTACTLLNDDEIMLHLSIAASLTRSQIVEFCYILHMVLEKLTSEGKTTNNKSKSFT